MNDETLTHLLDQLAEDAVPAEADVWPAVRAQLDTRPRAPAYPKGWLTMNPTNTSPARLRWLGLSTLLVVALAAALLALPAGRALAQSLWLFFNPAAAAEFDVPEAMGASEPGSGPTAMPPSFAADTCGADLACQLAAAEAAVGLTALTLPADLADLSWTYVEAYPESGTLILGYTATGGGGLVLGQSRGDLPTSPWEAVPADKAVAVTVNGAAAEYVEGTFVIYPGAAEAVWNADAPIQRLRWRTGDVLYELTKMGDPAVLEYLDQAALVALAERLQ